MSSQNNGQAKERTLSYATAIAEALTQEMDADPSVFVYGLDVDDHKSILGSTAGLLEKFGPERIFTTPLSEDAMTGLGIGAAMAGMRPVHVHIRMDFLMLCMNQLVNMAAKTHYMYGGKVTVPMVVRCIIGKSWGQGAQHSQALHAMFMHVPGMKVVAPSNPYDAKGCLIRSIRDNNPVLFVEHRLLYGTEAAVPEESFEVDFGQARVMAEGDDVTIVGISNMAVECLRAAELLAEVGISAEVIDPISLDPLDSDTIIRSAEHTGRLLIVDNGWAMCGASAEIVARVAERPVRLRTIRFQRMGFAPTTCPTTPSLEQAFYPNPASIAVAAYELVRPGGSAWTPDPERAALAYQTQFRGPF